MGSDMPGLEIQKAILQNWFKIRSNFGCVIVMIWGFMSWFGVSEMTHVEGRINSGQLIELFCTCLVPTVEEVANKLFSNARNNNIFRQDNDPKHTSRAVKN